jgi:hypothetical protein
MSHEEIKRLLESVDMALREIASHLRDSRDRERDLSNAVIEHRDDFDQFVEKQWDVLLNMRDRLVALEVLSRKDNESGAAQTVNAFGKLSPRAQALILAAAALAMASGWLSRLLG